MATLKNTIINDTGYLTLPIGNTAQRPSSPSQGMMRYNSLTGTPEWYSGTSWVSVTVPSGGSSPITGITYTVTGTYSANQPPTYQYMNDNNANGAINGTQWGSLSTSTEWIMADLGTVKTITKIIIGYDYLNNLPGGWGVSYTQGKTVETSIDNVNWVAQATTPTYASTGSTDGLVTVVIPNVNARYIRLFSVSWICTLEFQVWGY